MREIKKKKEERKKETIETLCIERHKGLVSILDTMFVTK